MVEPVEGAFTYDSFFPERAVWDRLAAAGAGNGVITPAVLATFAAETDIDEEVLEELAEQADSDGDLLLVGPEAGFFVDALTDIIADGLG
eukprot:4241331-Prorocentrum_lima.AAC.1